MYFEDEKHVIERVSSIRIIQYNNTMYILYIYYYSKKNFVAVHDDPHDDQPI